MAHEIKIPEVGESISEGTLAQWLKKDGEIVQKGENIVVIDTEKASQDLQADITGRLKIDVQEGTDVQVGQVIGRIEETSEADAPQTDAPAPETPEADTPAPQAAGDAAPEFHDIIVPSAGESISEGTIAEWTRNDGDHVNRGEDIVIIDTEKASADLQAEHTGILHIKVQAGEDVTIGQVIGQIESSGATASTKEDKALHVASPSPKPGTSQPEEKPKASTPAPAPEKKPAPAPAPPKTAPQATPPSEEDQPTTREPMTRMRRTIARRLLAARQETAMLTTFNDVDMSAIMAMRKKHGAAFLERHGVKLGFMSFFIQAAADALKRFPLVNASIDENDIIYHHYINIGVAVSTERGLAVPVIRNADELSFAEIESTLGDLAEKAKTGRIPLEDLKGGTFTITNGGVFGSLLSTPIINPPQVAILGMHSIEQRPVAIDGKVEIRPMMYLALSYDHRIIDGKEAVQFLGHIRDRIANPEQLLIGL